jgi:hypothetical protein
MRALTTFLLICIGLIPLTSCFQEEAPPIAEAPPAVIVKEFEPPADGRLNAQKLVLYKKISVDLVKLEEEWVQKLEKAAGRQQIDLLAQFSEAQDELCWNSGLKGFKEFKWIELVALADTLNRQVILESGIAIAP